MDKILRRVRMAERQVARRAKRREQANLAHERAQQRLQMTELRRQASRQLNAAIKQRHEDWELGPLAPRRDISRLDQDGNYWGSISADHASLQMALTGEQREARAAWAGGAQYLCLSRTDRVVVLDGPYKGKITKILKVNKETMTVDLEDIVVNQTIPDFIRPPEMDQVEPYQAPVPISSIRLVHPIRNPQTGVVRDVIIRQLKPVNIVHDRPTRTVTFQRLVPGENIKIPWPQLERKQFTEHPIDTKRIDVEERTFVPTLLRPPIPGGVIDELRNKYSKFRTRHTPEYIAQKEAEEAAKQSRKKSADTMLLPVQQLNRKLRAERRALGQPELTEQMLEKIGEVMAKKLEARAKGKTVAELERLQSAVEQLSIQPENSAPEDQPRS